MSKIDQLVIIFILGLGLARGALANPTEMARERLLARDRQGAMSILLGEIRKEKNPIKTAELLKELNRASEIFFTNEGQKNFELGDSIRFSGQDGYLPKYEEALKTEPGNIKVLLALSLSQIAKKKCDLAEELIKQAMNLNPLRVDIGIVYVKGQICQKKMLDHDDEKILKEVKQTAYYNTLLAQQYLSEDKLEVAEGAARAAIKIDPQYPGGYYWAWRAVKVNPLSGIEEAQRYLTLCKGITSKLRRAYELDMELCSDIDMVEEHLKKMESSTQ